MQFNSRVYDSAKASRIHADKLFLRNSIVAINGYFDAFWKIHTLLFEQHIESETVPYIPVPPSCQSSVLHSDFREFVVRIHHCSVEYIFFF